MEDELQPQARIGALAHEVDPLLELLPDLATEERLVEVAAEQFDFVSFADLLLASNPIGEPLARISPKAVRVNLTRSPRVREVVLVDDRRRIQESHRACDDLAHRNLSP